MRNYRYHPSTAFTLVEIMIVVAIIGLLSGMIIPNILKARKTAQRTTCINNLRQIQGAKDIWATENKASPNALPTLPNIQVYLGRGTAGTAPICPSDSANSFTTSYTINDLNTPPVCLIVPGEPGDQLAHRLDQ